MPNSFESVLSNIPFMGGALAANRYNEDTSTREATALHQQMGILQAIKAQQDQQELRGALARGDTAALMKLPGGIDILGKLATQQNAATTGLLNSARLAEIQRNGAVRDTEQLYKNALIPQLTQSQYRGETDPTVDVKPQLFQNEAALAQAAAEAERQGIPFRGELNNPNTTRALIAGAGNSIPRGTASELLRATNPPALNTLGSQVRPVAGGYLERQPDGTAKFVPTATGGASAGGGTGKGNDTTGELTPDAVENKARMALYDQNWKVGYGRDTRTIKAIENRMAEIMKNEKISPNDVLGGRAGFKADSGSLNQLTKQYDAVTAFEKTAIRNGDVLLKLADKADATGVPILEKWIRAGRQATGDSDVAKFNAQIQVYRTEAARILTNPNLTGVLTDSARKEVEHFLSGSASANQIREVVGLLKNDFENRKGTLEEQITTIRNRMKGRMVGKPSEGGAVPTDAVTRPATSVPQFASEADAAKANLQDGQEVIINGRKAVYRK